MNPVDLNQTEFLGRVQALERQIRSLRAEQEEQGKTVQTIVEARDRSVEYGHQNHVRNGDLHFTRNNYLYTVDFSGGTGEDGNVSEEAAHIYAHPKDTCVETTGSITNGSQDLTIDTPDFDAGLDTDVEIVIYGAGAAGADLITTLDGAPTSPTTTKVVDAASTTVTSARVRFRLLALKEDSTDENVDADLTTNTALKTEDHTRYATTVSDPDFDKTNGWVRWSDAGNMLTFPLPYNTLVPSKQYILTFLYKLGTPVDGEDEVFVDFFGGLWDNSQGRRQFLEGQIPSLDATVNGTPGATSRDYMVLMYLSDGSTVATETLTVANTNATIDSTNYVALSWTQEPGVVRSEIYRNTSGTIVRLRPPYPATTYYDTGLTSNTVGSFPTPTRARFTAFTQTTSGTIQPASQSWRLGQMNIVVPRDYNAGGTTDKQWLCLGMTTGFSGTDSDHALFVDMISLDDKFGIFTRCPLDFQAKRGVTIGPAEGDQSTAGGGGTDFPGSGHCPVFTDLIETDHGPVEAVNLVDNSHKYLIIDRNGDETEYEAQIIPPQEVYTLIAGDYKITASKSHPVFISDSDVVGKPLYRFLEGDIIYTREGLVRVDCLIKHFKKRHTVRITLKGQEKGFWQNGVAVHNVKPLDTVPL